MFIDKVLPRPTTPRGVLITLVLAPLLFAILGAIASFLYDFVSLNEEVFSMVQGEVLMVALWFAGIGGAVGLLVAWIQLLRFYRDRARES